MSNFDVVVRQEQGVIEFNFEEIKENLSGMMELYKDAQFSEESSTQAKKEVATLRKIKKALSDRRIEVKKECMKPYDDFETKVKELTALIDEPIVLIDTQVQAFEEKKKAEKKQKIYEIYDELIGDMTTYLPLTKIYDAKWENSTTSLKSIRDDIEQVVSSTEMAISTIKGMVSDSVNDALERYKADLSLANAIAYINYYEQQRLEIIAKEEERKRLAEQKRIADEQAAEERRILAEKKRIADEQAAEERRLQQEEEARIENEKKASEEKPADVDLVDDIPFLDSQNPEEPFVTEEPFTTEEPFDIQKWRYFSVFATIEELKQIEMFMNSIGVEAAITNE